MTTRQKAEGGRRKETARTPDEQNPRRFLLPPSSFLLAATLAVAALSGCGTFTPRPSAPLPPTTDTTPPPETKTAPRAGGYYLDDGPGANPPAELDKIPDAVPRWEPLRPANARPYTAMGVNYQPMTAVEPYKAQGLATWYGRRYHGKPTASGEPYDMYAMTGAHAVLPIPSYARVTNLKTGSSVVVRVNDRGPFVEGRLIDVSYTAAYKLGILGGATMVEVESIIPTASGSIVARQAPPPPPRLPESVAAAPPPVAEKPPVEKPAAPAPKPDAVVATAVPAIASPEPKAAATPPAVAAPEAKAAPTQPAVAAPEAKAPATPPAVAAPAASASAAVATAPQTPITTENGRVFLQLGAFASRENADGFLARLRSQVDWLALDIVTRDGLHRVQAGPYANQNEARQAAQRVAQALGIKPLVQAR